jgi:coenzyme F420-0:L-glutamate ligase/coenzyme F420-1:gamma-L-glutamate ligase
MTELRIFPIEGVPEIHRGDVLADLLVAAARAQGTPIEDRDCLVVTQKIVSKAEGRIVPLDASDPAARRALVESESVRVLRRRGDLVISETAHGFVCANAGVDLSNVEDGHAALLPVEPDRSARRIRDGVRAAAGVEVGVIVSDTFGRAWRIGLTDVAIGVSGLAGMVDLRGQSDATGRELQVTEIALVPAAIVRGLDATLFREGSARELVRPPGEDLFR